MSEDIEKAESVKPLKRKLSTQEKGQPHIITLSRYIQDQRNTDLQVPKRWSTFDLMLEDSYITDPVELANRRVRKSLVNGKYIPKSNNPKSVKAAKFLNYCIRNLGYGSWGDFCSDACTDLIYGFSLQNIVLERRSYGPYKDAVCLRKLAPRDQKSIRGWIWNKARTELVGVVQQPAIKGRKEPSLKDFKHYTYGDTELQNSEYTVIPIDQLVHFRHLPKNDNPQGDSPFLHIYTSWKELKIIENLELSGMQKDLVGTAIIREDPDTYEAAMDENHPDHDTAKQAMDSLQKDVNKMMEGRTLALLLSGGVDDVSGKPLQDVELLGIDGGGKQYSTSEVIKSKMTSIYNAFSAGHKILGQMGSSGSEALSSNKMTDHDEFVEEILLAKKEVIDTQIASRLLRENGIFLDYDDMPEFKYAPITKPDFEGVSKALQRLKTSNAATHPFIEYCYEALGVSTEGVEDIPLYDKGESRAGESNGTSGNGTEQQDQDDNLENKSYRVDDEDDDYVYIRSDEAPGLIKAIKE